MNAIGKKRDPATRYYLSPFGFGKVEFIRQLFYHVRDSHLASRCGI